MIRIHSTLFQILILIIVTVIIGLTNTKLHEAALRNLALGQLTKFLLQPSLRLDETLDQARDLFAQVVDTYDSTRYKAYQLRLDGWAAVLGEGAVNGPSSLHLDKGTRVGGYLHTIAQGSTAAQVDAIAQLGDMENVYGDDWGRFTYSDLPFPGDPFPVAFNGCADFELMAIYLSEQHVATRQPVPVVLVWQLVTESAEETDQAAIESVRQDEWTIYSQEDLLFQIGSVRNRLFDGGFEQTLLPRQGHPRNLPHPLYTRQTQDHTQLIYEFPEIGENMILQLAGEGSTAVGLGSNSLENAIETPIGAYLVSGRYRTVGEATPRIGIRWLLRDAQSWDDNVSSYVVREGVSEWTPFAGILSPHPEANALQYWVLNADANSELYVDNVAILPIPLPCEPMLAAQ